MQVLLAHHLMSMSLYHDFLPAAMSTMVRIPNNCVYVRECVFACSWENTHGIQEEYHCIQQENACCVHADVTFHSAKFEMLFKFEMLLYGTIVPVVEQYFKTKIFYEGCRTRQLANE